MPPLCRSPASHQRRQPELSALYGVVREHLHLEDFLREGQEAHPHGDGYPAFIENEFRRYLGPRFRRPDAGRLNRGNCGQLSRGFARLRCPSCGEERLVAFSCKGRLCPSCWSRRAADTAADLVDRVLPVAPYRQWVLTFPWELRYHLARDRELFAKMLRGFLQVLFSWQRQRGKRAGLIGRAGQGQTGSVTFVQRFSSALTLFPHVHTLVPDGLFIAGADAEAAMTFVPLPAPTDADIQDVTARVVRRLVRVARRHFGDPDEDGTSLDPDRQLLDACAAEALRRPRGQLQLPVSSGARTAETTKPLTARLDGFSLHAARLVPAHAREELERLCRYGLRPPFAPPRICWAVLPARRRPGPLRAPQARRQRADRPGPPADRAPSAPRSPVARPVLPPRPDDQRMGGVFAPRSRFHERLPPPPPATTQTAAPAPEPTGDGSADEAEEQTSSVPTESLDAAPARIDMFRWRRRLPWAELLLRVLDIDALSCPKCAGRNGQPSWPSSRIPRSPSAL